MKLVPALVVGVLVAGAGYLVYERRGAEPTSEVAQRHGTDAAAADKWAQTKAARRMARVVEALGKMRVDLGAERRQEVLRILDRCFAARDRVLADPALASWSEDEFARRYRGAIEPAMREVRETVGAGATAEAIVKRFIYDGRPIQKPVAAVPSDAIRR